MCFLIRSKKIVRQGAQFDSIIRGNSLGYTYWMTKKRLPYFYSIVFERQNVTASPNYINDALPPQFLWKGYFGFFCKRNIVLRTAKYWYVNSWFFGITISDITKGCRLSQQELVKYPLHLSVVIQGENNGESRQRTCCSAVVIASWLIRHS